MFWKVCLLLLLAFTASCNAIAEYGECDYCGADWKAPHGAWPHKGATCQKCGIGRVNFPPRDSAEFERIKREHGG